MSTKNLLLFDFDGTIADTAAIVLEVGNEVLSEYGLKTVSADEVDALRSKTARELMREFKIPIRRVPAMVASIRKALKERIDIVEPVDGMIELIEELSEKEDVELAVLSSNSLENIVFFLNKYKFRDRFSFMYGDVGVFTKYTKIRSVARREGKGARVLSIGDEIRDVEAARIARVDSISVAWGMNSADRLAAAGNTTVVSTVPELRAAINAFLSVE